MGSKQFKPVLNFMVIENPLTKEKGEAMSKHMEMLPSEQRQEYLSSQMSQIIHQLEVLDIGPDVTTLKVGDLVSIPGSALESAFSVGEDKLVLRATQIFGVWE